MNTLWRLKLIAFSIHLLFSAVIIGIFMWVATQFWFPDLLFKLENVWQGLQILIPVDAILGPILTLVLFVPGKKGLVGDLVIIATIQILALVFGGYTIYGQRPEIIVFAGDRFEIIPSSKFDRENFTADYFKTTEHSYPFIVYSLPAQTPEQQNEFVLENIQYQKMSERYRPINDFKDIVKTKALTLSYFKATNKNSEEALTTFSQHFEEDMVLLFILEGTTAQAKIIVLDSTDLSIKGYLDLDPWSEYKPPTLSK